jgi:DNA-binding transcriptional LysR family regulator
MAACSPWEFEKDGREVKVRVDGQLVFNTLRQRLDSALQGLGLAYMPEDVAAPCIASGDLIRVLEDWCPPFSGLPPLLPEPPPRLAGVLAAGGGAAVQGSLTASIC